MIKFKVLLALTLCCSSVVWAAPQRLHHASSARTRKSYNPSKEHLKLPLITSACQADEQWKFSQIVPEELQEALSAPPVGMSDALGTLRAAYAFRMATNNPEIQAFADYLLARSFYEMKLYHVAHSAFARLVRRVKAPSVGMESVAAALQCLHQMHRTYPTLKLNVEMTPTLVALQAEQLTPSQKVYIWRTLSSIAGRKLSDHAGYHSIANELVGLKGSGPYEILMQALDYSKRGMEDAAIDSYSRFLKFTKLPADLTPQLSSVHLNLGRLLYNKGQFREAVVQLKQVSKSSNLFPSSIIDSAWSYLLLGSYKEAASMAVNLVYREMRQVYAPHAPVLLAIIQFENCRYKESFESIKLFKKYYSKSYQILYQWYKAQVGNSTNYYGMLMDYFNKKGKIPKTLVSEWVKSPEYIGLQSEMNLIIDEDKLIHSIQSDLTAGTGDFSDFSTPLRSYVAQTLSMLQKSKAEIEGSLIAAINNEILWRNYHMMTQLVDAFDNSQLLEAEVLKELGTRVLDKDRESKKGTLVASDQKSGFTLPGLDWGMVSDNPYSDEEVWKDEIGAIQADVINLCPKTK